MDARSEKPFAPRDERHAGEVPMRRVGVAEAAVWMGRPGVRVIDVRSPGEFEGQHVAGAELMPLDRLQPALLGKGRTDGGGVLVFCQSGGRAGRAARQLAEAGVEGCAVVEGGMDAWVAAGLPVVKGQRRVLPLMRQVQLVVGMLSVFGAGMALAVDVRWAWLPLCMGLGLSLAGATGFCGLALVLAKMPWNTAGGPTLSGPKSGANSSQASCCGGEPGTTH